MEQKRGIVVGAGGTEASALTPGLLQALMASGLASTALVLPTAAAYEQPEVAALSVAHWLGEADCAPEALMVTKHAEANNAAMVARVSEHQLVVICSGAALHLRQVLLHSALLEALAALLDRGGLILGIGSGAHVLSDPMFDERGGALTIGGGLCPVLLATAPDQDDYDSTFARTVSLAPMDVDLAVVPSGAALAVHPDGRLEAWVGTSQHYRAGTLLETLEA